MSSTGIISKVGSASTTNHSEKQRKTDSAATSFPGSISGIRSVYGIISKVHPKQARLVKAYNKFNGEPLACDGWITLNHSAGEIIEKWGTVRTGFKVLVTYAGEFAHTAYATIIGDEDEDLDEGLQANESERGLFEIFTPGIGIG